jgi:biotin-dependent carboxylase-like uncharacterized protein
MDRFSHRVANLLVGNNSECATLEATLVGPTVEFLAGTVFAVAGGEFELWLDGVPVEANMARYAKTGGTLEFGRRIAGARAYLALAGGIDVPLTLGSRSTDLASGLGGRLLRVGDHLDVGSAQRRQPALGQSRKIIDLPKGGATLRFLVGPDAFRFSSEAMAVFTQSRYRVGTDSNRMGYRLIGKTLEIANDLPILSSATPSGTIQIPPSGAPILLMADHQTTGGYAKIGTVITVDLAAAGQLAPGDWVTFETCGHGEAVAALIAIEQALCCPA